MRIYQYLYSLPVTLAILFSSSINLPISGADCFDDFSLDHEFFLTYEARSEEKGYWERGCLASLPGPSLLPTQETQAII